MLKYTTRPSGTTEQTRSGDCIRRCWCASVRIEDCLTCSNSVRCSSRWHCSATYEPSVGRAFEGDCTLFMRLMMRLRIASHAEQVLTPFCGPVKIPSALALSVIRTSGLKVHRCSRPKSKRIVCAGVPRS
jgi:hypothetical protein